MEINNSKILLNFVLKFIFGLFFSIIFGISFAFGVDTIKIVGVFLNFGGDKTNVIFPLFFGIPLGSVIGFMFFDKVILKFSKINWKGIVLGFLWSAIFGTILSLILIDKYGSSLVFYLPILMVLIAFLGYQLTNKITNS